jgi:hypothetical protein
MLSISAICECVKPPKYASSTTRNWSDGSRSIADLTVCASSLRNASTSVNSGAALRSSSPSASTVLRV